MQIVLVHVHVKPDCIEEFKEITLENARNSVQEPGIARFDVIQQGDDLNSFCTGGGISRQRGPGQAQGNRSLPHLA